MVLFNYLSDKLRGTISSKAATLANKPLFSEGIQLYQNELNALLKKIGTTKVNVSIYAFENIAPMLFSHGKEFVVNIYEEIYRIFKSNLKAEFFIGLLESDKILLVISDAKNQLQKDLATVNHELKLFRNQTPDKPIYLRFNVGSTNYNAEKTWEEILSEAYIALFIAQNSYSNNVEIFANIDEKVQQYENQIKLASYFQSAIANKKLRLAFQPVVNTASGKINHHEALLRIVSDDGKIISAGPFIPVAESMGYIDQIDSLVLELVLDELRASPNIILAMNVSNVSIDNPEWILKARKYLHDPALASRLIIELTETSMHRDLRKVADFVDKLQSMGCKVAIDDFGSGYTSFTQLKMINADVIKIDGIFIRDIVDNPDSKFFVKTLLEFAKGFGIETIAEFVETGEIAKVLIELGVDYMQGNYFSPAVNYRSWAKEDLPNKT